SSGEGALALRGWGGARVENTADHPVRFEIDGERRIVPARDGSVTERGVRGCRQAGGGCHGLLAVGRAGLLLAGVALLAYGNLQDLGNGGEGQQQGEQKGEAGHARALMADRTVRGPGGVPGPASAGYAGPAAGAVRRSTLRTPRPPGSRPRQPAGSARCAPAATGPGPGAAEAGAGSPLRCAAGAGRGGS